MLKKIDTDKNLYNVSLHEATLDKFPELHNKIVQNILDQHSSLFTSNRIFPELVDLSSMKSRDSMDYCPFHLRMVPLKCWTSKKIHAVRPFKRKSHCTLEWMYSKIVYPKFC